MREVLMEKTKQQSKADNAKKKMLLFGPEMQEYTHRDRHNSRQTHRNRQRDVHSYSRYARTHTHTLVIVPAQAMRSLSDYRRVIEW